MPSVVSPRVPADFATQWQNLVRAFNQLQKSQVQPGAVIITNPNLIGTSETVPVAVTPPDGASSGLDPVTGQPLPGTPAIILQQGVYPVTDLVITPGAYMSDVWADVTWEVSPYSNAIGFYVAWGPLQADGSVEQTGQQYISGDYFRIPNLQPNTTYGCQVVAYNIVGQSVSTPADGFELFNTGMDDTVPPAIGTNGSVIIGTGATSVIVTFPALTVQQAADVANGEGLYNVELTNDPTWTYVTRETETMSTVVSFNDIYPNTTLAAAIKATDGPGTTVYFQDLSMMPVGAQWQAFIDDEYITFNPVTGNTAVIAQRNSGLTPLASGPEAHVSGATVTLKTQTTWYARVAAIDSSGNQSAWTYSNGQQAGGVTDSMMVGDLSASRITFGLLQGNIIAANSISVGTLTSGTITTAQMQLLGGSIIAGTPPTQGMVINSQGITFYNNGAITISLNALTGQGTFQGSITSGSTITGATIVGSTIETSAKYPNIQISNAYIGWSWVTQSSVVGNDAALAPQNAIMFNMSSTVGSAYSTQGMITSYFDVTTNQGGLLLSVSGGSTFLSMNPSTIHLNAAVSVTGGETVDNLHVTGTFTNSSDSKLKAGIRKEKFSGLETIKSVPVKSWYLKKDKKKERVYGLLADDLPDWMTTTIPAMWRQDVPEHLGVSFSNLIGVMWKAIGELSEEVDVLKQGARN